MDYPYYVQYPQYRLDDSRIYPAVPFLTGLAFGPLLYGAFNHWGYGYPYPPRPYYPPYGYGGYWHRQGYDETENELYESL